MKKLMMTLIAMVTMTISAQAMSYEQAREQALFLTDKMAYELNLTEDQYEAAYEVNLDYLLGVESQADLYGEYWTRRNLDLSYILLDWQYSAFCAASYFYRPLYWDAGYWHFLLLLRSSPLLVHLPWRSRLASCRRTWMVSRTHLRSRPSYCQQPSWIWYEKRL